jgi:hypothetical protein
MRKPGCTEPVIFFTNADGHAILAAYTGQPAPEGYQTEYADTLPDIRRLQKRLQDQEMREAEREFASVDEREREVRQRLHDRIYAKMTSSDTHPRVRDFLREWLTWRDEKKEKQREDAFRCMTGYLWALENDTPKGRRSDEERVSLDRINF